MSAAISNKQTPSETFRRPKTSSSLPEPHVKIIQVMKMSKNNLNFERKYRSHQVGNYAGKEENEKVVGCSLPIKSRQISTACIEIFTLILINNL